MAYYWKGLVGHIGSGKQPQEGCFCVCWDVTCSATLFSSTVWIIIFSMCVLDVFLSIMLSVFQSPHSQLNDQNTYIFLQFLFQLLLLFVSRLVPSVTENSQFVAPCNMFNIVLGSIFSVLLKIIRLFAVASIY